MQNLHKIAREVIKRWDLKDVALFLQVSTRITEYQDSATYLRDLERTGLHLREGRF